MIVIKLLTDSKGRLISLATGLVIGSLTKLISQWNWSLADEDAKHLAIGVALVVGWGIDALVLKINSDGVKRIQDALPAHIVSDGVPGDKTVAAVEKAVSESDSPQR